MIAYRIATEAPGHAANDLSGMGARLSGGRWNRKGSAMVYAASSRALAAMESLVHIAASGLPLNRYLVEIEFPDSLWRKREIVDIAELVGWDAQPPGTTSIDYGDQWLEQCRSVILQVPSVLVPEEANILFNPAHPGMRQVMARTVRKWLFDPRLGMWGVRG